ncbi:unnamed protein product, partial [marine sediment metagenome]
AKEPHLSPDGKSIVFVKNEGGRTNICLFSLETEEVTYLTKNEDYTQYFTPSFSPDGKRIVFSRLKDGQRDICFMCADGLGVVSLPNDGVDDRDPSWSRDGKRIIFSSDRTGIFNIYKLNLETKRIKQLTNVIGGAFEPSYSFDEKRMVFSSYSANGYDIKILEGEHDKEAGLGQEQRLPGYQVTRLSGERKNRSPIIPHLKVRDKIYPEQMRGADHRLQKTGSINNPEKEEEYPVRKYRPRIRPILWFPMGLSVMGYAQDVMGKHIFE